MNRPVPVFVDAVLSLIRHFWLGFGYDKISHKGFNSWIYNVLDQNKVHGSIYASMYLSLNSSETFYFLFLFGYHVIEI